MSARLAPSLLALLLLGSLAPVASPLAPSPVAAATDDLDCVWEQIVPSGGLSAVGQPVLRYSCEGHDDLTPVSAPASEANIYPPYCATGTRAFVTPRSYDRRGRVIAKDGSGKQVSGGTGWEPTSVASALVRSGVFSNVSDQLAMSYTRAAYGSPLLPNSFFWRALAPDLVGAYLQVEALPTRWPGASSGVRSASAWAAELRAFGVGALVRRDLKDRINLFITRDTRVSKASPYFTDSGYLAADEYGSSSSGFMLGNGAWNLTNALTTVGSPVWTLPIGKGASDLQLLPTKHLTYASIPGLPSPWSSSTIADIRSFWGGFALEDRAISVKALLAYTWDEALGMSPFASSEPVKAAVRGSFLVEGAVGGSGSSFVKDETSSSKLPIKMMYRVEQYVPVTRAVAWRQYQQVWVPPTTKQVCTTVNGKTTCTTVPVAGYFKWVPTGSVVGNPSATWIAAPGYPQPRGSATTQWRPVNKLVGYKIEMMPDVWAKSDAAMTSGILGTPSGTTGLRATQRYDADSPGGKTLLRRLEGDWWPVGVIPALKNAGDTSVPQVQSLLNQAVLRQLGRDLNGDKFITAPNSGGSYEGMTYGQPARWYIGTRTGLTAGTGSTLMLPAFRAPSEVLTGAAQGAAPKNAGDKAIEICGNPGKLMDFGLLGKMLVRPIAVHYQTSSPPPIWKELVGSDLQNMGMVLYDNQCQTVNIARATQYQSQLSGFDGAPANDTVGGACWVNWGLYRVPLPFIPISTDLNALFNYYRVARTTVCPTVSGVPDQACVKRRWEAPTTEQLETVAVVGKSYKIFPEKPAPGAALGSLLDPYLNVASTKSGFAGATAYISAGQVGLTLEIGKLCAVVAGSELVRYCDNPGPSAQPFPGRLITRLNRTSDAGYPSPIEIVFDRTPLSRLGDPDCRSLSKAELLKQCGIGYEPKSGNYFYRVRVRTWWNGVINHTVDGWPRPLGLFSNLRFDADGTKLGNAITNEDVFEYLRSFRSPGGSLGLSDRATFNLEFAQQYPPYAKPWLPSSPSALLIAQYVKELTDRSALLLAEARQRGQLEAESWGPYSLCGKYATATQRLLFPSCPVDENSPERRRRARPFFDSSLACNVDGGISTAAGTAVPARDEDCYLDIPVVSSQPGAN